MFPREKNRIGTNPVCLLQSNLPPSREGFVRGVTWSKRTCHLFCSLKEGIITQNEFDIRIRSQLLREDSLKENCSHPRGTAAGVTSFPENMDEKLCW